jgi:hypothetical protein
MCSVVQLQIVRHFEIGTVLGDHCLLALNSACKMTVVSCAADWQFYFLNINKCCPRFEI